MVKIEVTAEDGTSKTYIANIHRLSAKEAVLKELTVNSGTLDPEFSPKCLEYSGNFINSTIKRSNLLSCHFRLCLMLLSKAM